MLLSIVLLTSCEDSHVPTAGLRSGDHWRLEPPSRAEPGERVRLPDAHRARDDVPASGETPRRSVLNHLGRVIHYKTYEFALREPEYVTDAYDALVAALADRMKYTELRGDDGRWLPPVMLFSDRATPWSDMLLALRALAHPRVRVANVQIAVRGLPNHDRRIDALLNPEGNGCFSEEEVRVFHEVRIDRSDDDRVLVGMSGVQFLFPEGLRFEDEIFVATANAIWNEMDNHVPEYAPCLGVRLEVADPTVPWAHIVKLIDVLRRHRVRQHLEVQFEDDVRLRFGFTPEPTHKENIRPLEGQTLVWILVGLAVAVLVSFPRAVRRRRG